MNAKGDIAPDLTDIKRIMREYYQQLYANKYNKLDEKRQIALKRQLKKLAQDGSAYLNSPKSIK